MYQSIQLLFNRFKTKAIVVYSGLCLALFVPANAQTANPFDKGEIIPDSAGSTYVEQMVWAMKIFLKIALAFGMLALVLGGIWLMVAGLKEGNKTGQWGEFFMGLIMVIIAIVATVTIGSMAWGWIDNINIK